MTTMIDSVLDVIIAFLHVYHHSATAFLCFTQLNGKTSIVILVSTPSIISSNRILDSLGPSSRRTWPSMSLCVGRPHGFAHKLLISYYRLLLLCDCGWREDM